MTALGLVSRVSPGQTAVRKCTRDEGRSFGFGDQVADSKPPRAAAVKSRGGERRGNVGTKILAGKVERGERKQTASEASKAVLPGGARRLSGRRQPSCDDTSRMNREVQVRIW